MVAASVLGELVASLSLHCPCFARVERTQYENACESDPWEVGVPTRRGGTAPRARAPSGAGVPGEVGAHRTFVLKRFRSAVRNALRGRREPSPRGGRLAKK